MRRPVLVAVTAATLVAVAPAGAHVIASPTFLAAGEAETLELSVPNERDAPMTGFVVTAPAGVEIVAAEDAEGWTASVEGRVVTWSGGSLPAKLAETFGLRVQANGAPGGVELDAVQRYAGGEVRWPVTLTIVPGAGEAGADSDGSGGVVAVIVGIGALVTTGVALVALRRKRGVPRHET